MSGIIHRIILISIFLATALPGVSEARVRPAPPDSFDASSENGLVVLFTRVAPGPRVPEPKVGFMPYDPETGEVELLSGPVPGHRFLVGRGAGFLSNAGRQEWQGWVVEVEPGNYLIMQAHNPNSGGITTIYNRPLSFEVRAGEAIYLGDYSFFMGDYEPPHAAEVAGDFLTAFFTLGLVMPRRHDYSAIITWDEERARNFLAEVTETEVTPVRAEIRCDQPIENQDVCLMARTEDEDEEDE